MSVFFRVGLLLLWVIILFSGSKKTSWSSWFGLWTQTKNEAVTDSKKYIPKETMTDVVMDVLSAHGKVASDLHAWGGGGNLEWGNTDSIPWYLAGAQRLLYTDIVAYLENASNKETALDSYATQVAHYQSLGSTYSVDLQNMIQEQTALYSECGSQKTLGDNSFYQWLYGWDSVGMMQWLTDSQTSGMCQTKARISMNAYKAMLARVQNIQSVMTNLSTVLTQNRTMILTNFQLFRDSYLEQLITVRNQLRMSNPTLWVN